MFKKIVKDTSILSVGTLCSRILGVIRDVLVAGFFGTSGVLEAFVVAFRLPNLFRSILGEGFADSVATPVLSEYHRDKRAMFAIGNNLLSLLFIVLSLVTVMGVVFSKPLVILVAPGFITQPEKLHMAVSFTRITFLYLLFIGFAVNSNAILASLKKFFVPAINPIFLNIAFIAGIPFFIRVFENYILVLCVLIGGILQVFLPLFVLSREGFRLHFHLRMPFRDKAVMRMAKLFPPRIWSSIIYQLSLLIDTICASFVHIVGEGALAALWFAHRFVHLPLALIALPISRVALVDLSLFHKEGRIDEFKKLFVFSFQNIVFFVVPLCMFYLFLPQGIIDVVLHRGDFDIYSLGITASSFFFYSFGLFFFCCIKLLVNTYYALKDTVTPAKVTGFSLLLNIFFSVLLMFPLRVGGVALGSSLAALFNCLFLYHSLVKKIGRIEWGYTRSQFIRIILLSIAVGIISRLLWDFLFLNKYLKMAVTGSCALVVFLLGAFILKIKQAEYVRAWVLGNLRKK